MCVAGGKSNKTQPAQSKRVSKASLIQNTAEKSVFSSRSLITCSPALPPLSSSKSMRAVPRGRSLPQPQSPSGYLCARCLPLQTSIFMISFALLQKLGGNPIKTSGKPIPSPLENHPCEPPGRVELHHHCCVSTTGMILVSSLYLNLLPKFVFKVDLRQWLSSGCYAYVIPDTEVSYSMRCKVMYVSVFSPYQIQIYTKVNIEALSVLHLLMIL